MKKLIFINIALMSAIIISNDTDSKNNSHQNDSQKDNSHLAGPLKKNLENFSVIIEPKWINLEQNTQKIEEFGGKWILAGSIIFKKRAKEIVNLYELNLQWNGTKLDNLIGSLYKKIPDKEFIPIDDYLVCDGCWNKSKQILILKFDEKQSLGPKTIFYLVLTIPERIESQLKTGEFTIEKTHLPEQFKEYAQEHTLALALSSIPDNQNYTKTLY